MRIPRTLSIFRIFFTYLMRQNAVFSFFANFSKTLISKKKIGIRFSKVLCLRAFFRQRKLTEVPLGLVPG